MYQILEGKFFIPSNVDITFCILCPLATEMEYTSLMTVAKIPITLELLRIGEHTFCRSLFCLSQCLTNYLISE